MRIIHKNFFSSLLGLAPVILMGICGVGLVHSGDTVHADTNASASSTASVTVSSTCSMTANVTTAHSATINNNAYNDSIGSTTLQGACNDPNGFAIYAVGYTNDTLGTTTLARERSSGDTDTSYDIGSNPDETGGTAVTIGTPGDTSTWGMKLSAVTGTFTPTIENNFNNFHIVPDTYTKVANYNNGSSSLVGAITGSVTTTYGVSVSQTQPAGTYVGQVKYVLVHPDSFTPGAYTIQYNANGGTGTMSNETGILNYEAHDLAANTFTAPTDSVFAGWCTTNISRYSCANGTQYAAGQSVYSLGDANSTVNLYAIWRPTKQMQNFTCADSGLNVGDTTYLYDNRDNSVYLVGKLQDNKCWMLDNLALDPTTATLSETNTNATSEAIGNFKSDSASQLHDGWSVKGVSKPGANWNNNSPNNAYEYPYVNVAYKNTVTTPHYGVGEGKIGVYYNYCAASVGTYCYAAENGYNVPDTITDAPMDICPANWRMPTGGNDGEYRALCTALNGSTCNSPIDMDATTANSIQTVLSLPLPGSYWNGSQNYYGSSGYWWSSTYNYGSTMYLLYVRATQVWPMSASARYYGFTMRCLASS